MPELPEVEITVRDLKKKIVGQEIKGFWTDVPKLIKKPGSFRALEKELKGKKIKEIQRIGKIILIILSNNSVLLIHQKLTGHLLFGKWEFKNNEWQPLIKGPLEDPMNRFIHFLIIFKSGWMLALSDLRKFAKVELCKT